MYYSEVKFAGSGPGDRAIIKPRNVWKQAFLLLFWMLHGFPLIPLFSLTFLISVP